MLDTLTPVSEIKFGNINIPIQVKQLDKTLNLTLPDIMTSAKEIFTFQYDNNILFVSSDVENCGLWIYYIRSNSGEQAYTNGYYWNSFQIISNKCLITSSGLQTGVLLYKSSDNSISLAYEYGRNRNYFQPMGNNCLIGISSSSNGDLLLYDDELETVSTPFFSSGGYWYGFNVFDNLCFVSARGGGSYGIILYDNNTKTMTKIYNEGYSGINVSKKDNLYFISSIVSAASGILVYDDESKSISKIYETGYNGFLMLSTSNNNLFSSKSSSGNGILLHKVSSNEFSLIYDQYYDFDFQQKLTNTKYILGNSSGISSNLFVYDDELESVEVFSVSRNYGKFSHLLADGNCLLSNTSNSYSGLMLYNINSNTFTPYLGGYYGQYYFDLPNGDCLVGSDYKVSGTSKSQLLLYRADTQDIVGLTELGSQYNIFNKKSDGIYTVTSNKSSKNYIFDYNYIDRTLKLSGYNITLN